MQVVRDIMTTFHHCSEWSEIELGHRTFSTQKIFSVIVIKFLYMKLKNYTAMK
jgi:hypothetical protein